MDSATRQTTAIIALREELSGYERQFAAILPAHVTTRKFFRIALNAVQHNPKLLECDQLSFRMALMECAQYGLVPDSVRQLAHLVPFAGKIKVIVGYRGLMELALRHPKVLAFDPPALVYPNDEFEYRLGTDAFLHHRPADVVEGEWIYAYAVAHLVGGKSPFMVMPRKELDKVRDKALGNKKRSDTPWREHPEAMYLKTPVRRLCKWLPASEELSLAVSRDEMADAGIEYHVAEPIIEQPPAAKPATTPEQDQADAQWRADAQPKAKETEDGEQTGKSM